MAQKIRKSSFQSTPGILKLKKSLLIYPSPIWAYSAYTPNMIIADLLSTARPRLEKDGSPGFVEYTLTW